MARTPRNRWIEEGLRLLAAAGPDAVRVEVLAQAIGVTKGGFYWHFTGRDALLEAMLDAWEADVVDTVIAAVGTVDDAREALRRLFHIASTAEGLTTDIRTDLAIREWARRDAAVAARLARVDNRRTAYMRQLFEDICGDPAEAESRAVVAFMLWLGGHFLAGDAARDRVTAMQSATNWLLS